MGFEDEMAQHDEQWSADQAAPRRGRLEDGQHQAMLTELRIEEDDGAYTMIGKFQNKNGSIRKWWNLDHEVGRSIAAEDTKMFGYEGKMSGLRAYCESEEALWLVCEIRVRTKAGKDRDFTDVFVNRVLGKGNKDDFLAGDETSQLAGTAAGGMDDDIPF